mmetsp:Transcript_71414/g.190390  ORF Transcript_71414/g.190390 Transcript_71414/m.190390 type:complete len:255 (-) Transcript_71414:1154-1918(-)
MAICSAHHRLRSDTKATPLATGKTPCVQPSPRAAASQDAMSTSLSTPINTTSICVPDSAATEATLLACLAVTIPLPQKTSCQTLCAPFSATQARAASNDSILRSQQNPNDTRPDPVPQAACATFEIDKGPRFPDNERRKVRSAANWPIASATPAAPDVPISQVQGLPARKGLMICWRVVNQRMSGASNLHQVPKFNVNSSSNANCPTPDATAATPTSVTLLHSPQSISSTRSIGKLGSMSPRAESPASPTFKHP